jgi:hypothetical protein
MTSPSVTSDTAVPVWPPAPKSASVLSTRHGTSGVVKLSGADGGFGSIASLLEASVERTR